MFPENEERIVDTILERLDGIENPDEELELMIKDEENQGIHRFFIRNYLLKRVLSCL